MKPDTKAENKVQAAALTELLTRNGPDALESIQAQLNLISALGAPFRAIIIEFEQTKERLPTSDELIWLAGEHLKADPAKMI